VVGVLTFSFFLFLQLYESLPELPVLEKLSHLKFDCCAYFLKSCPILGKFSLKVSVFETFFSWLPPLLFFPWEFEL